MSTRNLTVPANGLAVSFILGSFAYCYIRTASNPVEISFDGNNWQTANLNDKFGPLNPVPKRIYLRALNGLAATVSFDYGDQPFTAQSTSQKVASTYPKGNNLAGLPVSAGVWRQIPSGDAGHQRKQIVFTMDPSDGAPGAADFIAILPAGSNIIFCLVTKTTPLTFETDAAFQCYGSKAGLTLLAGEIYYNS